MTSEIKNKTYSSVQDEIDALNVSKKDKLIALALSFFTGLLIVAGPITVFANLLMFENYQVTFSLLIALFIVIWVAIGDYMYLHLITKRKVEGLYHVWAIDILVIAIVVFVLYFGLAKIVFKIM